MNKNYPQLEWTIKHKKIHQAIAYLANGKSFTHFYLITEIARNNYSLNIVYAINNEFAKRVPRCSFITIEKAKFEANKHYFNFLNVKPRIGYFVS